MDQGIVAFGQQSEKAALDLDAIAAGAQKEHAVPIQVLPILNAGGRLEIPQQSRPFIAIGFPKQLDEPLPLSARGSLLQGHLKKDGVPPADLVVAKITDQTRVVAQRQNLLARDLVHAVHDLRVPHVPPRRAGG